jgi:hypothetical protein
MKFIHDTLVNNDIPYFICGGTLLGAVRHQGIIPHDDDGDICIFRKDVPKLRRLISYFDDKGYILEEGMEDNGRPKACTKSKDSCTWFISGKNPDSLGCDVFIMEQDGNKINYADPYWKTADNGGKRCYFDINHIFPLVPYRYGNFYLYGPRNAMLHLNTCYGPDWNSMGQTLYDHRTGEWTKGVKRELSSTDFLTLRPPTSTLDNTLRGVLCNDNKDDCTTYRGEVRERKSSKKSKKSKKSSRKASKKSKKSTRKASRKVSRKASKKSSRKVSRKASRKASRKVSRKASRKASRKVSRKVSRKY